MSITSRQTKILLLEEKKFSQLGFSMMLTRLKNSYAKEPSQMVLENAMNEINTFLDKFKIIMKNDFMIISEL